MRSCPQIDLLQLSCAQQRTVYGRGLCLDSGTSNATNVIVQRPNAANRRVDQPVRHPTVRHRRRVTVLPRHRLRTERASTEHEQSLRRQRRQLLILLGHSERVPTVGVVRNVPVHEHGGTRNIITPCVEPNLRIRNGAVRGFNANDRANVLRRRRIEPHWTVKVLSLRTRRIEATRVEITGGIPTETRSDADDGAQVRSNRRALVAEPYLPAGRVRALQYQPLLGVRAHRRVTRANWSTSKRRIR